ncbi:MAG: hypothetical protein ACMXYE_02830 [Candidatus Woesearchaeota archaeon]
MEFNYAHGGPGSYLAYDGDSPKNDTSDLGVSSSPDIEGQSGPSIAPGEIGQTVTEGSRFGTFLQTATGAIRAGASKIELQTNMAGGAEAVGAESYGQDMRQALRELAKANEVQLTSVHVPTQIGNVSGFNPQQGFVDEQRKQAVDEINKAVDFAADVTGGGTITFHTGEFQRPISEQDWAIERDSKGNPILDEEGNKQYKFLGYKEEPGRAVTYMVDDRTGKILSDVRKSMLIREPEFKRAEEDYVGLDVDGNTRQIKKGDFITDDGKYIDFANPDHLFKRVALWDDEYQRFKTKKLTWNEIEKRKDEWNQEHPEDKKTTEEIAHRIQLENQILQARGSSLFYANRYQSEVRSRDALNKALKFYKDLEQRVPKEEAWKLMKRDHPAIYGSAQQFVEDEMRMPSEIIKDALRQTEQQLQHIHQASSAADAQADTMIDTLKHVKPIGKYALDKSFQSMAESGIHAWHKTVEGKKKGTVDRDITLTAENIFPEMGYGSHPEELRDLILGARKKMVDFLTKKEIEDPHSRIVLVDDGKGGKEEKIMKVKNPWYRADLSQKEAEDLARRHIKANLDTQHLGMWGKHFQPKFLKDQKRMETPEETKKRFDEWYMDQVKMLSKDDIIGELHIVDGFSSGGHVHLPAGEGDLKVVDAVKYLREKGFKGVMMSEGHGQESWGPGRILTKTWEAFGSNIFGKGYFGTGGGSGVGPGSVRFSDIEDSYLQKKQGPYFVFGGYSPGNDWTLWSEVPLE